MAVAGERLGWTASLPSLLEGRLAFVTGAGRGMGRSLALGLARTGARVIATDIDAGTASETAELIRQAGGTAWSFGLDITSAEACNELAQRVGQEIGTVDLLVNNAAVNIRHTMSSPQAPETWRTTTGVIINGTFNVTHAFLPAVKASRGCIINMASTSSFVTVPAVGYAPSKGAIKMFTQSLAVELAPAGVRVNALAPGLMDTPMTTVIRGDPARLATYLERVPMGRAGHADEIVGAAVFLASDMASYITGVTLPVDGGFLA